MAYPTCPGPVRAPPARSDNEASQGSGTPRGRARPRALLAGCNTPAQGRELLAGLALLQEPAEEQPLRRVARDDPDEVAHEGELGHRRDVDRLAVRGDHVDEGGARLADAAVDVHRAGAADLLEAHGLPDDGGDLLAVGRLRVLLHLLERADDVHVGE